MKIQKLIQAKGVFAPLIRLKVSPKLSYKLLKFIRSVELEEEFFNSKLREIFEEYCIKDENGKFVVENDRVVLKLETKTEGEKALAELNDTEVDAPAIQFTLDELQDLTLSVIDMAKIEDFIKEE